MFVLFLRVVVFFPNIKSRQSHEVNVARQIERMKQIDEPKIIIIGGSGCGFGLCSSMISRHFNMPVCNTGTQGGMGILLQTNLCKDYIRKGDVVVVIPEYTNYYGNRYLGGSTALRILTSIYPDGYKCLSFRQQLYLIRYVPETFNNTIAAWLEPKQFSEMDDPYSQGSLNEYGDVEMYDVRWVSYSSVQSPIKWNNFKLQYKTISLLQNFCQYCKNQNAVMLLFPPAYRAKDYDVNQENIDMIWNALKEAQLPIVSSPERYKMADTLHYDTDYHLTYEGVIIRTNKLIADMDSSLNNSIIHF